MNRIKLYFIFSVSLLLGLTSLSSAQDNIRDRDITIGVMQAGERNSITDVSGVTVGHQTITENDNIRTGVTAVLPHSGNIFQEKIPAAIHVGNGFGKLAGFTQVKELGSIETPIILTNTLSVPTAADALIDFTFSFKENDDVRSVNHVVGETNDGYLNDIRGRHVSKDDVIQAIENASKSVEQGNVGAGTGTINFGFKGGIGTSSRILPDDAGGYTVGALIQSNFGGVLQIDGAPVGEELGQYFMNDELNETPDGSCMMVIATDAPLDARNLERLAKRAMLGLAKTGGIASNGSGDYVIAFSSNEKVRIPYQQEESMLTQPTLTNSAMSPLFMAAIEATEEAILNALFHAETMTGRDGHTIEALPKEKVVNILKEYNVIDE